MNRIHITTPLDEKRQHAGPSPIEMTLCESAKASAWGESLLAAFEVEILQGFWFDSADGSTTYCFELNDEKSRHLKQALTLAFFPPDTN
ncbi:hypothetical protein LJ737_19800 [Hymenobacter sp. 15J16-1T3B]|uniref:hypothetical protein n=1 Tax=Hymenobacter sp. 15J16-1T3B TaxID=2886941 RepID=UPI001D125C74|nr:hypothetical protein [Hymenobacter sp. 15J16-1T3B]MCC3159496.1 hypothetical protein [Hymenobacter sp. 15J16-1T3B]